MEWRAVHKMEWRAVHKMEWRAVHKMGVQYLLGRLMQELHKLFIRKFFLAGAAMHVSACSIVGNSMCNSRE
jgi:hypothetical protein